MITFKEETVTVRGRSVRLFRGGSGPRLLFLHDPFCPAWLRLHEKLTAHHEMFVPIHPGFFGSEDGFDHFEQMEDLIFHYLDLCEALRLERPALAGASFGGWLAAEWALRYSDTLSSLILIDALGLRLPEAPAADILSLDPGATRQLIFAEPSSVLAVKTIPDSPLPDAIVSTLLGRQTLARFAWQFPDNPRLLHYLHRVRLPTLIIWGERDSFVDVAHGEAYHAGIAQSEYVTIPNAGHLPHIEAPEACAEIMSKFLRSTMA